MKKWHIEISKERFEKLKTEERFWQLVTLSRAVNALRFVHSALLKHGEDDNSLHANRTRWNSFFDNCALLYEALLLVQRLPKYFRDAPGFAELHAILKDPMATELRNSGLAAIRNRLTFHFDEAEIGAQLARTDMEPRFVSGEGEANVDTYYTLADMCTMALFADAPLDTPKGFEKLGKRLEQATDLGVRFMNAAENFIAEVLEADGWTFKEDSVGGSL